MLCPENAYLADQMISRFRKAGNAFYDWRAEAAAMEVQHHQYNMVLEELAQMGWVERQCPYSVVFTGKEGSYSEWCRNKQTALLQQQEYVSAKTLPFRQHQAELAACILTLIAAVSLFLLAGLH